MHDNQHNDNSILKNGWSVYRTSPGQLDDPGGISELVPDYLASVPCTVASLVDKANGPTAPLSMAIDNYDWWFVSDAFERPGDVPATLEFDGLATLAEVWLNGERILQSRNMFRSYAVDDQHLVESENCIAIVFRALGKVLTQRHPRPRWKTGLVDNQALRWYRTALLGRLPGWAPDRPAIGPWRNIRVRTDRFRIRKAIVRPSFDGQDGLLTISASLSGLVKTLERAQAFVEVNGKQEQLIVTQGVRTLEVDGRVEVPGISPWLPHNVGEPALYDYKVTLCVDGATDTIVISEGRVGFRNVALQMQSDFVGFRINGREVFCRGACWTVADFNTLRGTPESIRASLTAMRDAGANMIRVGGTMVYESDYFYEVCDELGLMVWHDFMFANMDYPTDDEEFAEEVTAEVQQQISRLARFASVVCYCGNSEVSQQAAMLGIPPDQYADKFFEDSIPALLKEIDPGKPYVPSSPSGGALPFHVGRGISHYFGVGAYKKPVSDVSRDGVLFATECLGFSNVPDERFVSRYFGTPAPGVHRPDWKAGVPRDGGTGWDFEDIRDHYFQQVYHMDPVSLRYADNERYVRLSRVVSGDVMRRTFSEWRRGGNPCSGAIVWFMKDLIPGAGWGLLDSDNQPKAAYYFLKRTWASRHLSIIDFGLDGLGVAIQNESADSFKGKLRVEVLRSASVSLAQKEVDVALAANDEIELSIDEILGRFLDTNASYRFGPPKHDVVVASLLDDAGRAVIVDAWFAMDGCLTEQAELPISIEARDKGDAVCFELISETFLQSVELKSQQLRFNDNYFHLAPGVPYTVSAVRTESGADAYRGTVCALNSSAVLVVR